MASVTSAVIVAAISIMSVALPAAAQTGGQGYVYGGPLAFPSENAHPPGLMMFGGGLEALSKNGMGGSLEGGLIGLENLWVPQLSADALYEKRFERSGVRPFVSGGLSLLGGGQTINVGAGVNLWGRGRTAFRLDVRDYISPAAGGRHAIALRVGVTFR